MILVRPDSPGERSSSLGRTRLKLSSPTWMRNTVIAAFLIRAQPDRSPQEKLALLGALALAAGKPRPGGQKSLAIQRKWGMVQASNR